MTDPADVGKFVEITGADEARAKAMLDAAKGDMDAALALHYDVHEGDDDDAPMPAAAAADEEAAATPALPAESTADLVGGILSNARQEGEGEPKPNTWSGAGSGRALGSSTAAAPAADEGEAGQPAPVDDPMAAELPPMDRSNAKKVRVIFWADGFTVEDVTAEEAAAAAAAKAPPPPRRTGVASIRDSAPSGPGAGMPMPKLPELRKYEDEKEFMSDLQQSIPPKEFRELDLSTGTPRPRPVDIMLGDMRPQAYPADLAKRQNMMPPMPQIGGQAKKSSFAAFSGSGQTLGGGGGEASSSSSAGAASSSAAEAATSSSGGGGEWSQGGRAPPTVDEASATTLQVRLASGPPQRFKLNKTHTVADLKALVEQALAGAGEAARPYVLAAGFPPKPLSDDAATIEAAGLVGAAVTQRWA